MFKRKKRMAPPLLWLMLAVAVGGLLIGAWLVRRTSISTKQRTAAANTRSGQQNSPPMPSSRLGATEDQMSKTMPPPAQNPVRSGEVSVAGVAHEFDPDSITPG